MMYKQAVVKVVLVVLMLTAVPGCSRLFKSSSSNVNAASAAQPVQSPFEVKITKEKFDGEILTVTANLKSAYDWEADKTIVILRSLEDGEVLNEKLKQLSVTPALVRKGEETSIDIDVAAKGMTDYQLELEWGVQNAQSRLNPEASVADSQVPSGNPAVAEESKASLTNDPAQLIDVKDSKDNRQISLGTVSIENKAADIGKAKAEIGSLKVSTPDQGTSYQVEGELFNAGTSLLKRALIGINLGSDVKKIEIKNLHLEPGDSKKLLLSVPKEGSPALAAEEIKLEVIESD